MAEGAVDEHLLELRQVPVLRMLPPLVFAELAQAVRVHTVARGDTLAIEGRPPASLAWILEGRVRWTREARELGVGELGASVGLLELLAGAPASAGARAESELVVASLDRARFADLLEGSFDLLDAILTAVAGELCAGGSRSLSRAPRIALPSSAEPAHMLAIAERLVRLRATRPFGHAPIRALAYLAERGEVCRWARGARLWARGREAREVLALFSGEVRDGATRLVRGESVGLIDALAGRRREASAFASTQSSGLVFDVEHLIDALEDHDALAQELLRACAADLLATRIERGLPPDLFGSEPDRSLPRILRAR